MTLTVKVKLSLDHVIEALEARGKKYVTVRDLSSLLGVSTRTAGRLMARLEEEGYLRRYSNKAYKVIGRRGVNFKLVESW